MKIEIGKSYEITASWKKSLYEIEMFKHKDGRALNTETCWRNGTFIVHIEDEIEQLDLQDCIYDEKTNSEPDDWDYESYSNVDHQDSYDGCSEDFVHFGNHFTEDEQQALDEEYEKNLEDDWSYSRFEWLENTHGFESLGCNWQIFGGINVEEFIEE